MELPSLVVRPEALLVKKGERFRMDVDPELTGVHQVVPEGIELPGGGDLRIEVPDRAGRAVPGVREGRLPLGQLLPVHFLEGALRHIDLPPHLEGPGLLHPDGDASDGHHVLGDVLPGHPVPPGHRVLEPPSLVDEGHPEPVDLDLADVVDDLHAEQLPNAPVEGADIFLVETVS